MPVVAIMTVFFAVLTWAFLNGMVAMPFWPFVMGAAGVLFLAGLWVGKGAWKAPLAVLCGYLAMRGVMTWAADPVQEHAAFFVWFFVFLVLAVRLRAYIPGFAYLLSGSVYPVMMWFGFPIEYLGLAPIVAELFAIAALISMGGGLYDRRPDSRGRGVVRAGSDTLLARASLGLATA